MTVVLLFCTPFYVIPNLSTVITVPSNSYVYIATDGSAETNNISNSFGFSAIDVAIVIDGSVVSNGGYQPLTITNSEGLVGVSKNWGISLYQSLSAGTHTIAVYAASEGMAGGSSATVSGNSSSPYRGELTVILIKQ